MQLIKLIRLYPAAWRARYAAEFAALLQAQPASLWIVLEVVYGALDAQARSTRRRARWRSEGGHR
jgi:hypothetical protein